MWWRGFRIQGVMDKWSNGQGSLEKGSVMTICAEKGGRMAEIVWCFLFTTRLHVVSN
jgi:hypothetical protein